MPLVRSSQIGLLVSRVSYSSALARMSRTKARILSSVPSGRSWETPAGRTQAWFMRSPVTSSRMSRISSRSRKP
jgi:hypothetical protein